MRKTMAALAVASLGLFLTPQEGRAVTNCFDYAMLRLSADCQEAKDASGKPARLTAYSTVRERLEAEGYKEYDVLKMAVADVQARLRPGDIIIINRAHIAIVDPSGGIDHYLQVFDARNQSTDFRPADLPGDTLNPAGSHGGLFQNETFQQLLDHRAGLPPAYAIEVWVRNPAAPPLRDCSERRLPELPMPGTPGVAPPGPHWTLTQTRVDPDALKANDEKYNQGRSKYQISATRVAREGGAPIGDTPAPPWHAELVLEGTAPAYLIPGQEWEMALGCKIDYPRYPFAAIAGIGGGVGGDGIDVKCTTPNHPDGRVACGWVSDWMDADMATYHCAVPKDLSPKSKPKLVLFAWVSGAGQFVQHIYEAR